MNKLIKILKMDRAYYLQCRCRAVGYEVSNALITTLTYIDSLIARIDAELESNELIETIKVDRHYYQQLLLRAAKYDSIELITYYSTTLTYINSLITRIKGS